MRHYWHITERRGFMLSSKIKSPKPPPLPIEITAFLRSTKQLWNICDTFLRQLSWHLVIGLLNLNAYRKCVFATSPPPQRPPCSALSHLIADLVSTILLPIYERACTCKPESDRHNEIYVERNITIMLQQTWRPVCLSVCLSVCVCLRGSCC